MQSPPLIFDDALLARRRVRAREPLFLNAEFEAVLIDRLEDVTREFETAMLLGDTEISERMRKHSKIKNFFSRNDFPFPLTPSCEGRGNSLDANENFSSPFAGEVTRSAGRGDFDLIISFWQLGFINDLPGYLTQIKQALRPDGWLLAVFYGGETLIELRHALWQADEEILGGVTPRVAPMIDLRDAAGLLQRAGFALPVADYEIITVHYPDMFALMRELRGAGLNNMLAERRKDFTPKTYFLRAAEIYAEKFGLPNGKIPATVEVISLSAWAPAAVQQKPMIPGTATQRLADALNATEHQV